MDLGKNVVLERLEFTVRVTELSLAHECIYQTLQTIASPLFSEFAVWLVGSPFLWRPASGDGWKVVDAFLNAIAGYNPDFRIVFGGCYDRPLVTSFLPLASSKGLVQFYFSHTGILFTRELGAV